MEIHYRMKELNLKRVLIACSMRMKIQDHQLKNRKNNLVQLLVRGVIGQNGGIITQLMNWIQQLLIVSIAKLLLVVLAKMEQLLWLIILKDAKNILQIWI